MGGPTEFRAWLRQRRQDRGLTQENLGELVGYAGQTIRKIEGGQRRPSPQLALKLAQALQLNPDEHDAWMAAARADELAAEPSEPEPLRSPASSPQLPAYLTPFVGRERERGELAALLGRPDCRLITILGQGGVGKTRLAIEAARSVPGFADGVAFVSLASVAAPESIVLAIGDALGFAFVGTGDPAAQLIVYLRERRALLILDNLEHLLDVAGRTIGLVGSLLTHAPDVTILATSRERLKIAGEWVLELAGLELTPHTADRQPHGPALTLFAEHAERIDRAFTITPANTATVARICRLVDGLPLGIELAAAWLRLLSLDEIAHELTRSLDAAHLSPGALPARHHSLRDVVDHSWELLSSAERAALRQLSVFQGGFTREAAAHVAGAGLGVLANLADKSLLRRGTSGRYDLHEIIRQYADERLCDQPDELTATQGRHATYYLRFVAEREWRLKGAEQAAATAELVAEIDNIRAAWLWASAHGLLDELERAGDVLQWFHEFRSWLQEGVALFAQSIERLSAAATAAGETRRTLGRLLGHYGYLATRSGAYARSAEALAESYRLLADGADPLGLGRTLHYQASNARSVGDIEEARRLIGLSLALTATTGDRHVRAMSLTEAITIAHVRGEYLEAERLSRAALADWRELGNPRGTIWCITSSSVTLLALGKHSETQDLLREALALSHASDDRYGIAMTLYHLGLAAAKQNDDEVAIYFFREALPQLRRSGNWEHVQALNHLGAAEWRAGAPDEAWRAYREALAAALQLQDLPEMLRAMVGLAACRAHAGQHAAALRLATQVLAEPSADAALRDTAAELQRAARGHLPPDEATLIEAQAVALPLKAALVEYTSPATTR